MCLENPSDDSPPPRQRRRLIDDPRSIRALADPIRLQLHSIVGRSGQITAADAARELGISHALASHHLRQLAKYGFVEQIQGADRRERPWRVVHTSYSVEGIDEQPEGAAAVAVLEQVAGEQAVAELVEWHSRRSSWSPGWRQNTGLGRTTVYLTEQELAELVSVIDARLAEYVYKRPLDDLAARPPGSVPVEFTLMVVPKAPTSTGN